MSTTYTMEELGARADAFLTRIARYTTQPINYGHLAGAITDDDQREDPRHMGAVLHHMVIAQAHPWSVLLAAYVVSADTGEPSEGWGEEWPDVPNPLPGATAEEHRRAAYRMVSEHFRTNPFRMTA